MAQSAQGVAHLCVMVEEGFGGKSLIQGHFVALQTRQERTFGIVGRPAASPPEVHPCCFSTATLPVFWDLKLLNYDSSFEVMVPNVQQEGGGDAIALTRHYDDIVVPMEASGEGPDAQFSFTTTILKTGREAMEHMAKYFPKTPYQPHYIVCIGTLHTNVV
ncbi:hypothetical protein DFJ73DRAFT_180531 [Zopfochytrium polystomum]|nr:hypothetical protein DFJ73DRAFT_180531 [Zopfochytrium polystomum]